MVCRRQDSCGRGAVLSIGHGTERAKWRSIESRQAEFMIWEDGLDRAGFNVRIMGPGKYTG